MKTAARGRPQTEAQRQRVRFGKEEQQNECALTFVKKVRANDMTFAPTWSELGNSNARSLDPKLSGKIFSGDLLCFLALSDRFPLLFRHL